MRRGRAASPLSPPHCSPHTGSGYHARTRGGGGSFGPGRLRPRESSLKKGFWRAKKIVPRDNVGKASRAKVRPCNGPLRPLQVGVLAHCHLPPPCRSGPVLEPRPRPGDGRPGSARTPGRTTATPAEGRRWRTPATAASTPSGLRRPHYLPRARAASQRRATGRRRVRGVSPSRIRRRLPEALACSAARGGRGAPMPQRRRPSPVRARAALRGRR